MANKTCGECRYLDKNSYCEFLDFEPKPQMKGCANFEPKPTNGDRIRQGGNDALVRFRYEHRCDICAYAALIDDSPACRRPAGKVCYDGIIAWLNAPADCVKQNGDHDTQANLCKADKTESEEK